MRVSGFNIEHSSMHDYSEVSPIAFNAKEVRLAPHVDRDCSINCAVVFYSIICCLLLLF